MRIAIVTSGIIGTQCAVRMGLGVDVVSVRYRTVAGDGEWANLE